MVELMGCNREGVKQYIKVEYLRKQCYNLTANGIFKLKRCFI